MLDGLAFRAILLACSSKEIRKVQWAMALKTEPPFSGRRLIGWSTLRMIAFDVMSEVRLPAPTKSSGCPDVNSPDVIIKYEVV